MKTGDKINTFAHGECVYVGSQVDDATGEVVHVLKPYRGTQLVVSERYLRRLASGAKP